MEKELDTDFGFNIEDERSSGGKKIIESDEAFLKRFMDVDTEFATSRELKLTDKMLEAVANIVEIYQKLTGNYHAKVSGKATLVQCCLHDDSTPSMALYPSTSSYYCWGCSKHGNIFNLAEEVLRCSFKEALKFVEDNK